MSKAHTNLSKSLTWLLRHGACAENVSMDTDGTVSISDILNHIQFAKFRWPDGRVGVTRDDIAVAVDTCPKRRMEFSACGQRIRATQGHSASLGLSEDAGLTPILDVADAPLAIHGTTKAAVPLIEACGGLKPMSRMHVHFASGLPGTDCVISGMRAASAVIFHLDVAAALTTGLKLFKSSNGVILCPSLVPLHLLRMEIR